MKPAAFALSLVLGLALPILPGLAQDEDDRGGALGRAEDIDEDESPVIIERTPGAGPVEDRQILESERDAFAQIQGAWASDRAACASVDDDGGSGLYLTDTLIRWEGTTCSIRDIEVFDGEAKIYAHCTVGGGREDRTFELRETGEDTLALTVTAGSQPTEVALNRCPTGQ
ncbi:hypothetical protein [Chelativorans sp. AA-79]|uniref:hypothetical protein n=1 Tax=Chelativorans sp. AA-79 TaxID=3028735 RepID=UPI0023F69634|nr:hypothetical protein [Chelativorans sp. AA-79]WEX11406.1 hypothetical protein PVE73_10980 [Chelativorans sp. AA-79]